MECSLENKPPGTPVHLVMGRIVIDDNVSREAIVRYFCLLVSLGMWTALATSEKPCVCTFEVKGANGGQIGRSRLIRNVKIWFNL